MKKVFHLLIFAVVLTGLIINIASCKEQECEHVWSEPVVEIVATCGRSGVSNVVCTLCLEEDRIIIPQLPHPTASVYSYNNDYHWKEAVCEHSDKKIGYEEHTMVDGVCQVCNMAVVTQGLDYKGNLGEGTYSVSGIGIALDADIKIARYYNNVEIVAIAEEAFANCTKLNSVSVQRNVKLIGDGAFKNSTDLKYVQFTSALEYFGSEALSGCTSLEEIRFIGTKEQWYSLNKGADWDRDTGDYKVYCIDPATYQSTDIIEKANAN